MEQSHTSYDKTSLSLLMRAVERDQDAWQRLVRVYTPLICHWARRVGLQADDVSDVAQDVFLVLHAKISQYDPQRGAGFRAWLWGITRKKLGEFLRRRRLHPAAVGGSDALNLADLLADDADESTWHSIGRTGDEALLLAALDVVREDAQLHTWQAFWGMTVEGKSAAELAEVLGMTTKGVRQAKHRVLAKLREVLGDDASAILKHSMSADAAAWRSSQ